MLHELTSRAKLLAKKQLAELTATDGLEEEEDDREGDNDERDEAEARQSRSTTSDDEDMTQEAEQQRGRQSEEDEDEEEDEENDDDEEAEGLDVNEGDEQAAAGKEDEAVLEDVEETESVGDADEAIDIDDLSQPATLLQTTADADEDDEATATSIGKSATLHSSIHPELLSADRFLSHFSHHRSLPADVLVQLTSNTAQLQPLPSIDGIRERLFTLNINLPVDERQHAVEQEKQQSHSSASHGSADADKAETLLGVPALSAPVWLRELHVRPKIIERWQPIATKQKNKQRKKHSATANSVTSSATSASPALLDDDLPHPLQRALFPLLSTYRDVVFPALSPSSASSTFAPATHIAMMQAYCLHVVNHVVRAREAVLRHNAKLGEWHKRQQERRDKERQERQLHKQQAKLSSKDASNGKQSKKQRDQHNAAATAGSTTASSQPPEYRDQGFTRCRVLILLPYAHFAYSAINCILSLLPTTGKVDVLNRRRFEEEFGGQGLVGPEATKPADHRYLMTGELNDAFRIGVSLGSRGVRLYAPFHASDIIVASPLGLKLLLDGGEGHDWLSSVEVLVMDQTDVFGMQNWQHVDSCLEAINQLPTGQFSNKHTEEDEENSGSGGSSGRVKHVEMDISRVKNYYLDSHAAYYRQTIVLANHLSTDIHHLVTHKLHNYAGLVLMRPLYTGILTRIHSALHSNAAQRQIFHRFHASALQAMHDDRFDYFTSHIFPTIKTNYDSTGHVMIVVPSYGDFLRLRNHFQSKHYNYVALSEYTTTSNVSRHRSNFYHGRVKYLIMTERFYYYRRYRIRGVGHIVFYALPQYNWCYEELVNAMEAGVAGVTGSGLCVALYCAYDARELERIVGTQRSLTMLSGERTTHMFS